jgi:hypothetical protein
VSHFSSPQHGVCHNFTFDFVVDTSTILFKAYCDIHEFSAASDYQMQLFRPRNNKSATEILKEVCRHHKQEQDRCLSSELPQIKEVDIYIPKHCSVSTTRLENILLPSLGLNPKSEFGGFGNLYERFFFFPVIGSNQ